VTTTLLVDLFDRSVYDILVYICTRLNLVLSIETIFMHIHTNEYSCNLYVLQ
jgi:hypothetical protein